MSEHLIAQPPTDQPARPNPFEARPAAFSSNLSPAQSMDSANQLLKELKNCHSWMAAVWGVKTGAPVTVTQQDLEQYDNDAAVVISNALKFASSNFGRWMVVTWLLQGNDISMRRVTSDFPMNEFTEALRQLHEATNEIESLTKGRLWLVRQMQNWKMVDVYVGMNQLRKSIEEEISLPVNQPLPIATLP